MEWLYQTTVTCTITALAILAVKFLFRKKMSPKMHVALWGLLFLRFFLPELPQSRFSIFNMAPELPPALLSPDVSVPGPVTELINKLPVSAASLPENFLENQFHPLVVAYVAGAALLFLYLIAVHFLFSWKTAKQPEIKQGAERELLTVCCRELGIRKKIRLRRSGNTPMLKGIFRPVILLPEKIPYSQAEYKSIFYHELCHYKYGDVALIWLLTLFLCMNWYNPIIWGAFFLARRDIEILCDQRVTEKLHNKKEYAALLLKTALSRNRYILGTTSLQNGEKQISKRIRQLATFKKPAVLWSVVLLLAAALIAVLCLTNAQNTALIREEKLFQNRTEYIGDNVRTSRIAELLPMPEGVRVSSIQLQTAKEPYGIEILCDTNLSKSKAEEHSNEYRKNARIFFSLVKNAGEVTYVLSAPSEDPVRYTYRRGELETEEGLWAESSELKRFQEFYHSVLNQPNPTIPDSLPEVIRAARKSEGYVLVNEDQIFTCSVRLNRKPVIPGMEKVDTEAIAKQYGFSLQEYYGKTLSLYLYDTASLTEPLSSVKYSFASVLCEGKEILQVPLKSDQEKEKWIQLIQQALPIGEAGGGITIIK